MTYTPRLVPAAEWSAEPWRYAAMLGEDTSTRMDGWVGHWPGNDRVKTIGTGWAPEVASLLGQEHYHIHDRKWRGWAYDYGLGRSGNVYIGRGTGRSGATSGDYDEDGIPNNRETDAITLLNGVDQSPTNEQIESWVWLIDHLGGPRRYIIGHRQAKGTVTSCPGEAIMRHVIAPSQNWAAFRDAILPPTTGKGFLMALVKHGEATDDVAAWQAILNRTLRGTMTVKVDRDYGDGTAAAVAAVAGGDGKRITGRVAERILAHHSKVVAELLLEKSGVLTRSDLSKIKLNL